MQNANFTHQTVLRREKHGQEKVLMFPLLGHRRVPTFNLHVNVCYFFLERNKTNNPVLLSDPAHRWRSWGWPWAPGSW